MTKLKHSSLLFIYLMMILSTYSQNTSSSLGNVVINEFMVLNDTTVADPNGEYDQWVELYNKGSAPVLLDGYYMSNDSILLTKWRFPAGLFIGPNQYLIIWTDADTMQSGIHTNFKLIAAGGILTLLDNTNQVADYVIFPPQLVDKSYARIPNGIGSFSIQNATFNVDNGSSTNIDNMNAPMKHKIYPNPAQSELVVELGANSPKGHLELLSTLGMRMKQRDISQGINRISLADLEKGIYLISINGNIVDKVVKN